MILEVADEAAMKAFGAKLGALLKGGNIVELIGDVGAGKTTLTKGIATGMNVDEDVQSPSFTISRVYEASKNRRLAHYDFYRLHDAGIMANELEEALNDQETIVIIEWAEIVTGVLPADRVRITIIPTTEEARKVTITAGGPRSEALLKELA